MKRISFIIVIAILFFIILHLITSIYTLWHKQDLLTNAQQQLQQQKRENSNFQKELIRVKSSQFLDEEARNKLLLVKPNESDVIIDPSLLQTNATERKKATGTPYWQQWIQLFF